VTLNVASLSLAQAVRRRISRERTAIEFGGSNCEDEMGRALSRRFSFIEEYSLRLSRRGPRNLHIFCAMGG
jgi:hypothetical protein